MKSQLRRSTNISNEASLVDEYKAVARTLVEHDIATEINAGLYYRYPVKEFCPSPMLLDILIAEGVKFTTSSDSHYPNDLGIYTDEINKLLVDKGVKEVATFDKRQRIMRPI